MSNFIFELGDEVKDDITGFRGIIRVRSDYLTGCNVYGIQSQKLKKDGDKKDWQYFDEGLLSLCKKKKVKIKANTTHTSYPLQKGGPHSKDEFAPTR